MITIHDLANHILKREAKTGLDFEEAGLNIIGGCRRCEATLAAYNAYPSKLGVWLCKDCINEDEGFRNPEHFKMWEKGQSLDGNVAQRVNDEGFEKARSKLEDWQEMLEEICEASSGEDQLLFSKAFSRIQGILVKLANNQCPVCRHTIHREVCEGCPCEMYQ